MQVLRALTLIILVSLSIAAAAEDTTPRGSGSATSRADPEGADIIRSFAKRTGKKFIIDPRVRFIPGFAGIEPDRITYEQLLATLSVNQFATFVQGDVVTVVPDANARQLPTPVYSDANFKAGDDEWVTLLLTPKKACTPHLVPILRPLMPQAAHMAADLNSNSLIMTDRAANLRRVADLVERLDKAATGKLACGGEKAGS
jgi:general secretion pathway protein D